MRRNLLTNAMATCTALAAIAVSNIAFAQNGLDTKVSIYLKGAELATATQLLHEQTGLQFVIAGSLDEYAPLYLAFEGPASEALQYICQSAGAYVEKDEKGVFIIRKGPKPNVETPGTPVKNEKVIVKAIQLKKADPLDVLDILVYGTTVNPYRNYNEMLQFQKDFMPSSRMFGGGMTFLDPNAIKNNNGLNLNPAGTPLENALENGFAPGGELTLPGAGSGQRAGGGGLGQSGGGGGNQPGGGGGNNGQGGIGGGGSTDFGDLEEGDGLVPDGTDSLGYDPTTNSIIFRGTDEAYQKLLDLISMFDNAPKQVVIKVEFITTSSSVDRSLGIDWLYQRGTIFAGNRPGTFARSGDPIFINYATGNITTRLRALMSDGYGRTVNAPLIRTLNNQPASVFANTQISFIINQTVVTNGIVVNTPTLQQFNVSTFLQVKPRINGDGTITMFLTPTISDLGQLRRSPDGTEIPDILVQGVQVVARVKSGETIALAGLTRKQDNFSQSRIPLLGELPIIGQLFRGRNSSQNTSELLIFVTPTIMDDDNLGLGGP